MHGIDEDTRVKLYGVSRIFVLLGWIDSTQLWRITINHLFVSLFQYIASPHPYPYTTYPAPSIIHTMPLGDSEQTSNAASPDDSYQQYQAQQPK